MTITKVALMKNVIHRLTRAKVGHRDDNIIGVSSLRTLANPIEGTTGSDGDTQKNRTITGLLVGGDKLREELQALVRGLPAVTQNGNPDNEPPASNVLAPSDQF